MSLTSDFDVFGEFGELLMRFAEFDESDELIERQIGSWGDGAII